MFLPQLLCSLFKYKRGKPLYQTHKFHWQTQKHFIRWKILKKYDAITFFVVKCISDNCLINSHFNKKRTNDWCFSHPSYKNSKINVHINLHAWHNALALQEVSLSRRFSLITSFNASETFESPPVLIILSLTKHATTNLHLLTFEWRRNACYI